MGIKRDGLDKGGNGLLIPLGGEQGGAKVGPGPGGGGQEIGY